MFQLPSIPNTPIIEGQVCTGMKCGSRGPTVSLFPPARIIIDRLHANYYDFPESMLFATASSSEEPSYSRACLNNLTTSKGIKINGLFHAHAIGRTGELSSRKTSHFAMLKKSIKDSYGVDVDYGDMLFFDDCNWGDHVGDLGKTLGVTGVRTPAGLTVELFEKGLELFRKNRGK